MKNIMNHRRILLQIFFASLLLLLSKGSICQINADAVKNEGKYSVKLIKDKTIPVSSYLLGFNLEFVNESDSIWSDGKIEGYLKEVNVGVMRYPGGTICSFYHWNQPTGEGWKDCWDPNNPVIPKPNTAFMDVDEFISLTKRSSFTPVFGINMSSGRRWNRVQDGIEEAIALMKYCRDKNFKVKYWYLDNEPYMKDSNGGSKTVEEYAELINQFAPRMKEFDPDIKIIANWNASFKTNRIEYQKLLKIAGLNIDIIDVHWYWSWSKPTFEKWLSKTPMEIWSGDSYLNEIAYFHQMVKDFGYPNIKLASLEWNLGPVKEKQLTPDQCALIESEMLMQFMSGGLDMAIFWPLQWSGAAAGTRSFVNRSDRSAQPVYKIFKFLGKIQGANLYKTEVINDHVNVLTLASKSQTGEIRVCFLNKNGENIRVDIDSDLFNNMKLSEATAFVLSGDESSSNMKKIELLKHIATGIAFDAFATSLTMLTFTKK